MSNPIFDQLCRLGVCDADGVEPFHHGVRDRDDIDVLRCRRSGALFLHRTDHMDVAHYDAKPPTHRHGAGRRQIITSGDDTQRRLRHCAPLVRGRTWLDIGAGSGAMLDVLSPLVTDYAAVEPQEQASAFLREMGHPVHRRLDDVPAGRYAVVTLFHVFEHLTDPLGLLRQVRTLMPAGGRLVIEVPHARDLLIGFARSEAFCRHTFWSEHLFLHTRETLRALVAAAGFEVLSVQGVQRYPVANHLHWLAKGEPAGHLAWNMLVDERLDGAYADVLARLDLTDTLVLEAQAPAGEARP
jgi:2-polyprenyl-3-methyl-5-hydroxy-6-metoxy-1,4-benzoquinol methylase